ncbi:unnamed protein product [Mytilus edulis]|uniref:Uncharacterized protein n=1 Tax=Mytilus edulis TaxID=6550 RepID=A0A8S3T5Q0_MYTED|nr:unnamed protein product [Mytilus edulis]
MQKKPHTCSRTLRSTSNQGAAQGQTRRSQHAKETTRRCSRSKKAFATCNRNHTTLFKVKQGVRNMQQKPQYAAQGQTRLSQIYKKPQDAALGQTRLLQYTTEPTPTRRCSRSNKVFATYNRNHMTLLQVKQGFYNMQQIPHHAVQCQTRRSQHATEATRRCLRSNKFFATFNKKYNTLLKVKQGFRNMQQKPQYAAQGQTKFSRQHTTETT